MLVAKVLGREPKGTVPGKVTQAAKEAKQQPKEDRVRGKEKGAKVQAGIHLHLQQEDSLEVISVLRMAAASATASREASVPQARNATTPMCANFVCQRTTQEIRARRLQPRIRLEGNRPESNLYRTAPPFADCSLLFISSQG